MKSVGLFLFSSLRVGHNFEYLSEINEINNQPINHEYINNTLINKTLKNINK